MAGMTCALSIANQGHEVYLVEKESDLGGMARKIHYTLEGWMFRPICVIWCARSISTP